MAYFTETISHSTTGVKTRPTPFQAAGFKITTGPKATSEAACHQSVGNTDGTLQLCDAVFQDATRGKSNRYSDRLVSVWEWNGAAFVEVCRADLDSITATDVRYNVVTATTNYQFKIEAWD